MGPGLAYAMGNSWEQWGFEGGGLVGLTFAAIGLSLRLFWWYGRSYNGGIRNGKSNLITSIDSISDDIRRGVYKDGPPTKCRKTTISH